MLVLELQDNNNHHQDQFKYLHKKWKILICLYHMVLQNKELLKHIFHATKILNKLPTSFLRLEQKMKIQLCNKLYWLLNKKQKMLLVLLLLEMQMHNKLLQLLIHQQKVVHNQIITIIMKEEPVEMLVPVEMQELVVMQEQMVMQMEVEMVHH